MEDLKNLYERLNEKYFNNKLPKNTEVIWTNKLRESVGDCDYYKRVIRLQEKYHSLYPEEIESTLNHEMIHLKYPNHSKLFYKEMKRIQELGGKVSRLADKPITYKYVYYCSNIRCDYISFTDKKRNKLICSRCKSEIKVKEI